MSSNSLKYSNTATALTIPVKTADGLIYHLGPEMYKESKFLTSLLSEYDIAEVNSLVPDVTPIQLQNAASKHLEMFLEFYQFVHSASKEELELPENLTQANPNNEIHPWFREFFQRHTPAPPKKGEEFEFMMLANYLDSSYALNVTARYIASVITQCRETAAMRIYLEEESDFEPGEEERLFNECALVRFEKEVSNKGT